MPGHRVRLPSEFTRRGLGAVVLSGLTCGRALQGRTSSSRALSASTAAVTDQQGPPQSGGARLVRPSQNAKFKRSLGTASAHQTRQGLLDAAEQVFAAEGWSGASIREITARAGTNVAAVHYHFGGKQELLARVLERRAAQLNRTRLARLELLSGGKLSLEMLVRAFIEPTLELLAEVDGRLVQLHARAMTEASGPWSELVRGGLFQDVHGAFAAALHGLRPDLPPSQCFLRLHAMIGALTHLLLRGDALGDGRPPLEPLIVGSPAAEALVQFLVGGLAAAPVTPC